MRIGNSQYKCSCYPAWVMGLSCFLPHILAFIVLLLTWKDTPYGNSQSGFVMMVVGYYFFYIGMRFLYVKSWFSAEAGYFLPLAGSVYVALQDPFFGWGYVAFLTVLLIPYYHALVLQVCFTRHEKLQSLVGQEGIVVGSDGQCHVIVEIDGEEFDASPWRDGSLFSSWTETPTLCGLERGTTVVVIRAGLAKIDVKQKPSNE